MIKVENMCGEDFNVSINTWDENGSITYRTLKSGGISYWERGDSRGYVMSLQRADGTNSYFLLRDSEILVKKDVVKDKGVEIESHHRPGITQEHLDDYQALHPDHEEISNLTLEDVHNNTSCSGIDWSVLAGIEHETGAGSPISDCEMKIAYVIFDVICLAIGAVGLRSTVRASTIEVVAEAAGPAMSRLEETIARIAAEDASLLDQAMGVFDVLKTIYSAGCLGAVFSAFTHSLTWWDAVLYGIVGTATMIAAVATDGAAFAAEVALVLASFGFLVSDSVKAVEACD